MGRIDLKVGYSCNDACLHCVVDDFRETLRHSTLPQDKTLDIIKDEMRDARTRGEHLTVTGGEPTIRPDFVEIIRYARELDYDVLVQTNGRRLSNPELVRQLKEFDRVVYCIALHGPTAQIHDAITQRPGSFAQTVQGFRNLYDNGLPYTNKVVLSKLNYRHLPELCAFMLELHANIVNIAYPHAQGRARQLWESVVPTYTEVAPYVHRALDFLLENKVRVSTEAMPYCLMEGYESLVAEAYQSPEEYSEINQYGSTTGIQNWSKVRLAIKSKFPQCQACRFDAVCEGPWNEYAQMFGSNEFTPIFGQPVHNLQELLTPSLHREFPLAFRIL